MQYCVVAALRAPVFLKVLSGQIGSASVSLERPWKRHQPLYFFYFFIFKILNFLKTSKFWAASYKNASNPPTCWDHGLYGHKPRSFPPNRTPKMRESQQLSWDYGLWVKNSNIPQSKPKIEQHFGGFFQQIKVWRPIERKDSKQPVIPTSRRIRCIFAWSGSELWLFSNIQDQN